mmetsp:Transcript_89614/g.141456  ORF Transcript_89614/g.141456 Transcript_89614/m.141456 type:complete len:432 (-) Transcript_89614:283-1578(-)
MGNSPQKGMRGDAFDCYENYAYNHTHKETYSAAHPSRDSVLRNKRRPQRRQVQRAADAFSDDDSDAESDLDGCSRHENCENVDPQRAAVIAPNKIISKANSRDCHEASSRDLAQKILMRPQDAQDKPSSMLELCFEKGIDDGEKIYKDSKRSAIEKEILIRPQDAQEKPSSMPEICFEKGTDDGGEKIYIDSERSAIEQETSRCNNCGGTSDDDECLSPKSSATFQGLHEDVDDGGLHEDVGDAGLHEDVDDGVHRCSEQAASGSCAQEQEHMLWRGAVVLLQGLEAQPQMNGMRGLCLGQGKDDRWTIHLDSEEPGTFRNVRRQNLRVLGCGCKRSSLDAGLDDEKWQAADGEPNAKRRSIQFEACSSKASANCLLEDMLALPQDQLMTRLMTAAPEELVTVLSPEASAYILYDREWKQGRDGRAGITDG